jgi:mannosyltransferase
MEGITLETSARSAIAGIRTHWFQLGLVAQVAVGAVVATAGIGDASFWLDESASASVAARSFGGIFEVLGHTDANMGLYYLLLHVWMWGGDSESWIRLFSALCMVATIPVTALLGRRLFGDVVGIVAGFVLALSPYALHYAQQARGYALALLLTTVATWLFVEAAERRQRALYAGYAVASVLAVYANAFSALVILAHALSLLVFPELERVRRDFAIAFAAIVLAIAPLAVWVTFTAGGQVAWIGGLTISGIWQNIRDLVGGPTPVQGIARGSLLLIGLVALWRSRAIRINDAAGWRWRSTLVTLWLLLPPLFLIAISVIKPVLDERYLIGIASAIAILVGVGLRALVPRSRVLAPAAVAVFIALAVFARPDIDPTVNEDLSGAADLIASESRPGDGIAYSPDWARVGLDWDLRKRAGERPLPVDFTVSPDGRPEQVGDLWARELPPEEVAQRLQRYTRVWLIGYPDSERNRRYRPTAEPMHDAGVPVLEDEYTPMRYDRFGDVRVELWTRRPAAGAGPD